MKKFISNISCCMILFNLSLYGQDQNRGSTMIITSPAFHQSAAIPTKYTCSGQNVSPELRWSGAPDNTKSFVLMCNDPDAPQPEPWVHWIVFNIPSTMTGLEENQNIARINGAKLGATSSGNAVYEGPCPPKDHGVHRYFFTLYALDTMLNLDTMASKKDVVAAIAGHVLDQAEIMGTYQR